MKMPNTVVTIAATENILYERKSVDGRASVAAIVQVVDYKLTKTAQRSFGRTTPLNNSELASRFDKWTPTNRPCDGKDQQKEEQNSNVSYRESGIEDEVLFRRKDRQDQRSDERRRKHFGDEHHFSGPCEQ